MENPSRSGGAGAGAFISRPHPPLTASSVQHLSGKLVDRGRLIAQRHILPAAATGIPALPALPPLLTASCIALRSQEDPILGAS